MPLRLRLFVVVACVAAVACGKPPEKKKSEPEPEPDPVEAACANVGDLMWAEQKATADTEPDLTRAELVQNCRSMFDMLGEHEDAETFLPKYTACLRRAKNVGQLERGCLKEVPGEAWQNAG